MPDPLTGSDADATRPPEQVRLLDRLGSTALPVSSTTSYGAAVAAVSPAVEIVEFFSDTEQGSDPYAMLSGLAWRTTEPTRWHALAVPNLITDDKGWAAQDLAMRMRCIRAAVEHRYYGPFLTALDLSQHLLTECQNIACGSWWTDFAPDGQGYHAAVDYQNITILQGQNMDRDAPHHLCQHIRAVAATIALAEGLGPRPQRQAAGALTVLALSHPQRARAVGYLLDTEPSIRHTTP